MKREHGRWPNADGDLTNTARAEKQRRQPAEDPVSAGQVRRPLPWPPQDDQLLLEQKILGDDGSHATGATQSRGR